MVNYISILYLLSNLFVLGSNFHLDNYFAYTHITLPIVRFCIMAVLYTFSF